MEVRDCGKQDDDGTYADVCGPPQRMFHIGGVLPFPTHALGEMPTSRPSMREAIRRASALDR